MLSELPPLVRGQPKGRLPGVKFHRPAANIIRAHDHQSVSTVSIGPHPCFDGQRPGGQYRGSTHDVVAAVKGQGIVAARDRDARRRQVRISDPVAHSEGEAVRTSVAGVWRVREVRCAPGQRSICWGIHHAVGQRVSVRI